MTEQQRHKNLILECEKMIGDLSELIRNGETRLAELKRIKYETEIRLNNFRAMLRDREQMAGKAGR